MSLDLEVSTRLFVFAPASVAVFNAVADKMKDYSIQEKTTTTTGVITAPLLQVFCS